MDLEGCWGGGKERKKKKKRRKLQREAGRGCHCSRFQEMWMTLKEPYKKKERDINKKK